LSNLKTHRLLYRLAWLSSSVLFPLMALMAFVLLRLQRDVIFVFFSFTVMAFGLAVGQALYFLLTNGRFARWWFIATFVGFGIGLPFVIMMGFVIGFFYLLALGALFNGLLTPLGIEGPLGQALLIATFLPLPAAVGAAASVLLALLQSIRSAAFGITLDINQWLKRNAIAGAFGGAVFMLLIFLLVGFEVDQLPGLWLALGLPFIVGLPLGLLTMGPVEKMREQLLFQRFPPEPVP